LRGFFSQLYHTLIPIAFQLKTIALSFIDRRPEMAKRTDLVQGTLDLLILRTLTLQPMHGWGIAQRIPRHW